MTVATVETVPALDVVVGFSEAHPEIQVRAHLQRALRALQSKRPVIDLLWRYYDGDHPQLWMTEKMRTAFGRQFSEALADNYCALVVDAAVLRLQVTGWAVPAAEQEDDPDEPESPDAPTEPGEPTDADLAEQAWDDNDLDLDQEELYRAARVAGEAYVIVWPREGGGGFDVSINDARNVHLEYGSSRRRDRAWAAKVWLDAETNDWRANIYYPDELVRMVAPGRKDGRASAMPTAGNRFQLDPVDPGGDNVMGRVPVVPFATSRRYRSALHDVIPIQNKINKLAANKMVAAEFLAWGQRWIMTDDPTLTKDKLRPSPGSVLVLDPGGETEEGGSASRTQVGEWDAAQLDNYDDAHRSEVEKLTTIAVLPRHMLINPGQPPSGDSIRADEGPFVSVVTDAQQMYGGALSDVMALMGLDVEPVWADPEVANDEATARTVQAYTTAGVPVDVALRKIAGWSDADLEEVREGIAEARKAQADAATIAMAAFDQARSVGDVGGDGIE